MKLNSFSKNVFRISHFIYNEILKISGLLIDEDLLSIRLGISKESKDWDRILSELNTAKYTGIYSDIFNLWWMSRINSWWKDNFNADSLQMLNAKERFVNLKEKYEVKFIVDDDYKKSIDLWTICQETKLPLDIFDGILLQNRSYEPWQDKRYISEDGYLKSIDKYKDCVSISEKNRMKELYK